MKITLSLLIASFTTAFIANTHAAVIQGSGWNRDVIVDAGAANPTSATNFGWFGNGWVYGEAGYAGSTTGTNNANGLVITSNIVTTQNGTEFFVDPTVNNTITGNTTFVLNTAAKYTDLQFLVTGGSGTFNATVNFNDASTQAFTFGIDDWQGSRTYNAFAGSGTDPRTTLISRRDNNYFSNGVHIRELSFNLLLANQAKDITTIDFSSTGTLGVTGVSGTPVATPIPEPSSTALLGLGGLALIMRRRS